MKKPVYIRCPRCELNFCEKKDKYCVVCKQEMKALSSSAVNLDEETELDICPVCKSNYIQEDELMCANCAKEKALEDGSYTEAEAEADWVEYVNQEDNFLDNEELGEMVSITSSLDGDDDKKPVDEEDDDDDDEFDDDLDLEFDDFDDDDDEEDEEDEYDDEEDDEE